MTATGLAQLAPTVTSGSRRALRKLRLFGTFDPTWISLAESTEFTAAELTQVEAFLADRSTRGLLSLLALTLLTNSSPDRVEALKTLADTFENLVKRAEIEGRAKWHRKWKAVWTTLLNMYEAATPSGGMLADAAEEFGDFITTPISSAQRSEGRKSQFPSDLASLCADVGRVGEALDMSHRLRSAIADSAPRPIITYHSAAHKAAFEELYVNRSMQMDDSGQIVHDSDLMKEGIPYRRVLKGAPGAGKSTFVQHFRRAASGGEDGQPVLVVIIREYAQRRGDSILDFIHEDVRANYSVEISRDALRDVLILGQPILIFDGLDEVTDLARRSEICGRIASFASEYPAVSILVTSRAVGYEKAPLPSKTFRTMTLREYTPEQEEEYVEKWFSFVEQDELILPFRRESESLQDLTKNPLLLSLLCILYRARGSIPRRRREIYAQCADLLFHTWDSHRQVDQPEELHANGDAIMQEIARWVYTSSAAQGGLSESVISKTIGQYLTDHVGVAEGEARRRATAFLEFCANRAWLLGVVGTEHGERLFGFTHRTFLEYFAAESFSRMSRDAVSIALTLLDASSRDSTSVLPELLLQAYDQKVHRGASAVFREAYSRTNDDFLILRLMEGSPLPSRDRSGAFERVFDIWRTSKWISEASFLQLLRLNLDARSQFVSEFLDGQHHDIAEMFLGGWASLSLKYDTSSLDSWEETAREVYGITKISGNYWFSASIPVWAWASGLVSNPPSPASRDLLTRGASGYRPGSAWIAIEMDCGLRTAPSAEGLKSYLDEFVTRRLRKRLRVERETAGWFGEALGDRINEASLKFRNGQFSASGNLAYLYLMCVLYEAHGDDEDFFDWMYPSLSESAQWLWLERRQAQSDEGSRNKSPNSKSPEELPQIMVKWAKGTTAFVKDF